MKSIVLLMPWFGPWPAWMELFLSSCRFNPTVKWVLLSDQPCPSHLPDNVALVPLSMGEFSGLVATRLDLPGFNLVQAYKVCDLRFAFGRIFAEHIQGYDLFGFGDLDVVYGNLRAFLTDEVLSHNVVSCHKHRLSGHFCLFANTEVNHDLYLEVEDWRGKFMDPRHLAVDDRTKFTRPNSLYFESFNTPHCRQIVWTNGLRRYPREWYWKQGRLTNNMDAREFLYFHFMVWKGGRCGRMFGGGQFERLPVLIHDAPAGAGWRINERGFWRPADAARS